jgi:hypothetical protein
MWYKDTSGGVLRIEEGKMDNGMLKGFLEGRAEHAWQQARTEPDGGAARMWLLAVAAYQQALDEYTERGDSEAVKAFTEVGMDAADDALKAARA